MNDLESMGYTVITDVLTSNECDEYQQQLKNWLIHFGGGFPGNRRSVIQNYSIGHLEPCWKARLKAKPAFADIWGTDKLLSSMDGIAFHRPPEEGTCQIIKLDSLSLSLSLSLHTHNAYWQSIYVMYK